MTKVFIVAPGKKNQTNNNFCCEIFTKILNKIFILCWRNISYQLLETRIDTGQLQIYMHWISAYTFLHEYKK